MFWKVRAVSETWRHLTSNITIYSYKIANNGIGNFQGHHMNTSDPALLFWRQKSLIKLKIYWQVKEYWGEIASTVITSSQGANNIFHQHLNMK